MSESPNETAEPSEPAESETPAKVVLTEEMLAGNDLGRLMVGNLKEYAATMSAAQRVIDAANADDAKLLVINLRPEHPKYAEYQAANELVNALAAEMDRDNAEKVEIPSADEVAIAETTLKETKAAAQPTLDFVTGSYADYDLSEIIPVSLQKRRGRPKGSGEGAKRPRLANIVVSVNEETVKKFTDAATGEDKSTFSNLAKWLSANGEGKPVNVKDLQAVAFEVAQTQDLSTVEGPIEFVITRGTGDNTKHFDIAIEARGADK